MIEEIFDHVSSLFKENGVKKEDFLYSQEDDAEVKEICRFLSEEDDCFCDGLAGGYSGERWIGVSRSGCHGNRSVYITLVIDPRNREADFFVCDFYMEDTRYCARMFDSGDHHVVERGDDTITAEDKKIFINLFDEAFEQFKDISREMKKIHLSHGNKDWNWNIEE